MNYPLSLGVDIGSTTAKLVLMDGEKNIYQKYERHLSQVRQKTFDMVREIEPLLRGKTFTAAISGSAGMGLAEAAGIPFVQEVYATGETVRALEPDAGTVIELGGEDAKVIFFKGGVDERMNGSCAGGTGAFIDQMATLLDMPVSEMDRLSLAADRIYPIASRCGVFAKTDIQPLLNQGALKSDVAASIYQAVVNQTIAGLIQGRTIEKKVLSEEGGPVGEVKYAARWNIVPADTAAYLRGELTDPVRPITMYMDPNMPETWREPVKRGILSWNRAFEKAGFREVIRVEDFPKDDPAFNPYGINTSCVWYAPSNIENAEGHFWTDPRTGEIRGATMVLHQHVAAKINRWRFVQTAQIDPRVRNVVMPREVMDESLAYVAAHEMGHCLGLAHNMAGSSAIPVDSLRSATFTQKYGTTASIMDYARFNYVAQPGDEGVRLTPPEMGVYDEYAIGWLYRFVPDAAQERATLDAWIARHAGDPMCRYAALQDASFNRFDPSALGEDLGDDAIRAGEYGIRNLKYIMDNLPSWIGPDNDPDGAYRKSVETKLLKQYQLYLETVWRNVGGIYVYNRGDRPDGARYKCVPREVQKRSVEWVFGQLLGCEQLQNPEVYEKFSINVPSPLKAVNLIMGSLGLSYDMLAYCNVLSDDPYTLEELFDDIYENGWKNSIENRKLTAADKLLQRGLLRGSELRIAGVGGTRLGALSSDNGFGDFPETVAGIVPDGEAPLRSYVQPIVPGTTQKLYSMDDEQTLKLLKKLKTLLEKRVVDAADPADIPFYRAQLFSVNKLLKPKK